MFNVGCFHIDGPINYEVMEEEDDQWCYYSGMPSPMAYVKCDECGELLDECECDETKPVI